MSRHKRATGKASFGIYEPADLAVAGQTIAHLVSRGRLREVIGCKPMVLFFLALDRHKAGMSRLELERTGGFSTNAVVTALRELTAGKIVVKQGPKEAPVYRLSAFASPKTAKAPHQDARANSLNSARLRAQFGEGLTKERAQNDEPNQSQSGSPLYIDRTRARGRGCPRDVVVVERDIESLKTTTDPRTPDPRTPEQLAEVELKLAALGFGDEWAQRVAGYPSCTPQQIDVAVALAGTADNPPGFIETAIRKQYSAPAAARRERKRMTPSQETLERFLASKREASHAR